MALTTTEEAQIRQLLDQQSQLLTLAAQQATISSKLSATKKNLGNLSPATNVNTGDLTFVRQGTSDRHATLQTLFNLFETELDQGASLTENGWKRLSSGLIVQWLKGASDANGIMTLTNPRPFPNEVLWGVAGEGNPQGWGANTVTVWGFNMAASTLTTSVARVRNIVGTSAPVAAAGISGYIFVIGY